MPTPEKVRGFDGITGESMTLAEHNQRHNDPDLILKDGTMVDLKTAPVARAMTCAVVDNPPHIRRR